MLPSYQGAGTWEILHQSRTRELNFQHLTAMDVLTYLIYDHWFWGWQMVSSSSASRFDTWWVGAARRHTGPGGEYYTLGYHSVTYGAKTGLWETLTPVMQLPEYP